MSRVTSTKEIREKEQMMLTRNDNFVERLFKLVEAFVNARFVVRVGKGKAPVKDNAVRFEKVAAVALYFNFKVKER